MKINLIDVKQVV